MRRFIWNTLNAPSEPPAGGPPAATPPPAQPQIVYVQAPPGIPVAHRVSGALIVGIVVVVMALGGGTAAGLALFRHPTGNPSPTLPTPPPPVTPPPNQPSPVVQPSPVAQASPSPAEQPSPAASSGGGGGGGGGGGTTGATIETNTVSIDLPSGWQKGTVDNSSITIIEPNKGLLFVASGKLSAPSTNEAWVQHLVEIDSKSNTSAALCQGGSQANPGPAQMVGVPTPANGESVAICVVDPKGGKFIDLYYFSLLADQSGNTYLFEANAYSSQDGFSAFVSDVNSSGALGTIKWKLLKAN